MNETVKKPSGKFGIISLLLYILEQNIDDDFICLCEHIKNIVAFILSIGVPSFISFFITHHAMGSFPQTDSRTVKDNFKQNKLCYSILSSAVWLFLCLIDSRYLACIASALEGVHTETDTLKWCKPSGNQTILLESEEAQKWMSMSQVRSEL